MADKRIDQLNASPGLDLGSLFENERDPAGTKAHEKLTAAQLMSSISLFFGIFIPFETTALLKANTNYIDGHLYLKLGDLVRGDGGSAAYFYDATDVQPDNGFSVVVPNAIVRPAPGSYLQINL